MPADSAWLAGSIGGAPATGEFRMVFGIDYFYDEIDEHPFLEIEIKRSDLLRLGSTWEHKFDHEVHVTSHLRETDKDHGLRTVEQAQKIFNSLSPEQKIEYLAWVVDELGGE